MLNGDPQPEPRGFMDNSFWLAMIAAWVVMACAGITLALALGIWNLIGAF